MVVSPVVPLAPPAPHDTASIAAFLTFGDDPAMDVAALEPAVATDAAALLEGTTVLRTMTAAIFADALGLTERMHMSGHSFLLQIVT